MSQGQYFDAAGTSPAYYYIGNDDEQIFRSSNGITWTQQADVTGEYFNDFAYGTFGVNNSSIENGEYSVSIDTAGAVTMATGRGTVLFGNIPDNPITGSTHFHIMKDSPSTVDLFFGDDYNYVKLPTTQGVEVGATGSIWRFGTDGRTTFPNGTTPEHSYGAVGDKEGMIAFDDTYIYYCTADYVDNTTNIWKRTAHGTGTW